MTLVYKYRAQIGDRGNVFKLTTRSIYLALAMLYLRSEYLMVRVGFTIGSTVQQVKTITVMIVTSSKKGNENSVVRTMFSNDWNFFT